MPVKDVEDLSSFEEVLDEAGDKLVIVDFHARWCGPCKQIGPELSRLSNSGKYPDVVFVKVDVDLNSETAEAYDINCMPTFLFFRKGKKIDSFSGANKVKLLELLDKLVKKK